MSTFFSCREQFLVVAGLVAHRIYCAWPNGLHNYKYLTSYIYILGPCPSRGALVSTVGSLSDVMHSDVSTSLECYLLNWPSNTHFGHHGNIFRFHSNRYLTLPTPRQQFILKFNAKECKENAQLATCYAYFGCYGNIFVSMVTDILENLFSPFCNHPYATPKPTWQLFGSWKVFYSPWQRLPW